MKLVISALIALLGIQALAAVGGGETGSMSAPAKKRLPLFINDPDPAIYCVVPPVGEKPKVKCGERSGYDGTGWGGAINVQVGCGLRFYVAEIGDYEYETQHRAEIGAGASSTVATPGFWAVIPTLGESLAASSTIAGMSATGKAKKQIEEQFAKLSVCKNIVYPAERPTSPEYVTVSGAVYRLEPQAPKEMQPAYRDPQGLVWGRVMNYGATFEQATKACANVTDGTHTARLPTKYELLALRESMSRTPEPNALKDLDQQPSPYFNFGRGENPTFDPSQPAIPAFLRSTNEVPEADSIWSSSTVMIQEQGDRRAVEYNYMLWGKEMVLEAHHVSPTLSYPFPFNRKAKAICVIDLPASN